MPSLSQMNAQAKSQNSQKKISKSKASTPKPAAKLFSKSSERVTESDIESETESEEDSDDVPSAPAIKSAPSIPTVNGVKPKVTAPVSSSNSDNNSSSSDSSSATSDSDSGSDSGSEAEVANVKKTDAVVESATPVAEAHVATKQTALPGPKATPITTYKPPKGFESLSGSKTKKSKASQVFSAENLAGKQIWYITAPVSVPISMIKNVSMKDVQSGSAAITVDGEEYGFVLEKPEEQGSNRFTLPSEDGSQYRLGKRMIDSTLHLQQVVKIPSAKTKSKTATVPQKKPVRQQPEGLKMRFKPIGFGSGGTGKIGGESSSDSDSESEDDASTAASRRAFRVPPVAPGLDSDDEMADVQNASAIMSGSSDGDEDTTSRSKAKNSIAKVNKNTSSPLKRKLDAREDNKTSGSVPSKSPKIKESKPKKIKTKDTPSTEIPQVSKSIETGPPATSLMPPPPSATKKGETPVPAPIRQNSTISRSQASPRRSETPILPPVRRSSIISQTKPSPSPSARQESTILPPRLSRTPSDMAMKSKPAVDPSTDAPASPTASQTKSKAERKLEKAARKEEKLKKKQEKAAKVKLEESHEGASEPTPRKKTKEAKESKHTAEQAVNGSTMATPKKETAILPPTRTGLHT